MRCAAVGGLDRTARQAAADGPTRARAIATAQRGAPESADASTERADRPSGRSLSPSRAADFMTCPLLYRFRVIDRLPEQPSPAAARGTLVHAVLERLFDAPAGGAHAGRARGR